MDSDKWRSCTITKRDRPEHCHSMAISADDTPQMAPCILNGVPSNATSVPQVLCVENLSNKSHKKAEGRGSANCCETQQIKHRIGVAFHNSWIGNKKFQKKTSTQHQLSHTSQTTPTGASAARGLDLQCNRSWSRGTHDGDGGTCNKGACGIGSQGPPLDRHSVPIRGGGSLAWDWN